MSGLAPSVISADIARFGDALTAVEPYAARWHVDVMDGHFVPNLTIGPAHVRAIAALSPLPQDLHLMVSNPDSTWQWYAENGAARIAFHPDASKDAPGLLQRIASAGCGPGLAVNPDVHPDHVHAYLPLVDHLVVMSVYPGFSGQAFIPEAVPKLRELRRMVDEAGLDVCLVIDGGVSPTTAPACVAAGADILVSASAVFSTTDPSAVARELQKIALAGERSPID